MEVELHAFHPAMEVTGQFLDLEITFRTNWTEVGGSPQSRCGHVENRNVLDANRTPIS
jgi:hypothetical protein